MSAIPQTSGRYLKSYCNINQNLILQGLLFYLPHWIWKNWEEGKVRMISDGMRGTVAAIADDKPNRQVNTHY